MDNCLAAKAISSCVESFLGQSCIRKIVIERAHGGGLHRSRQKRMAPDHFEGEGRMVGSSLELLRSVLLKAMTHFMFLYLILFAI